MLFHSATDVRHGVEEKFWLAQTEQANLYSDRAQEALETVKVVCAVPSLLRGTNKFSLPPPEVCRRSDRNPRPERRLTRARAAIEVGGGRVGMAVQAGSGLSLRSASRFCVQANGLLIISHMLYCNPNVCQVSTA